MEILGEIRVLIEELNHSAGNSDLARKIEVGDKLATYNWNLAEQVADVNEEANMLEYQYKTGLVQKINALDGPQGAKEAKAKEMLKDLHRQVVEKQNLLHRLTLLHRQTNVVIEQNRQSVSALKMEYKQLHG